MRLAISMGSDGSLDYGSGSGNGKEAKVDI